MINSLKGIDAAYRPGKWAPVDIGIGQPAKGQGQDVERMNERSSMCAQDL